MRPITPDETPDIDVPLSHGIVHEDLLFISGQVPFDMQTGDVVGDDIGEQTDQTLDNVTAVLNSVGASLDDVLKTTVFLVDITDFDRLNEVYRKRMSEPYPARSVIEVSDLAADILVEIEAVAQV